MWSLPGPWHKLSTSTMSAWMVPAIQEHMKGEEILMEARILAVADVVESMASHRPYRPALGLNAALEEIENNKGTLYDADVVDVCLRLFRQKGFQFEGTRF